MKVNGRVYYEKDCGWRVEVRLETNDHRETKWSDNTNTITLLGECLHACWGISRNDEGHRYKLLDNSFSDFEEAKKKLIEILDKFQADVKAAKEAALMEKRSYEYTETAKALKEYVEVREV